jgi:hypothetical protein
MFLLAACLRACCVVCGSQVQSTTTVAPPASGLQIKLLVFILQAACVHILPTMYCCFYCCCFHIPAGSRRRGCLGVMPGGTVRSLSALSTASRSGWMQRTRCSCCTPAAARARPRACCTPQVKEEGEHSTAV